MLFSYWIFAENAYPASKIFNPQSTHKMRLQWQNSSKNAYFVFQDKVVLNSFLTPLWTAVKVHLSIKKDSHSNIICFAHANLSIFYFWQSSPEGTLLFIFFRGTREYPTFGSRGFFELLIQRKNPASWVMSFMKNIIQSELNRASYF